MSDEEDFLVRLMFPTAVKDQKELKNPRLGRGLLFSDCTYAIRNAPPPRVIMAIIATGIRAFLCIMQLPYHMRRGCQNSLSVQNCAEQY